MVEDAAVAAAASALEDMAQGSPYGQDWMGSRMDDAMNRLGGPHMTDPALERWPHTTRQVARDLTQYQWAQAPLTHGLYGYGRPSNYLDWRMRQQDEITGQHFANIAERGDVLGRLWRTDPYAGVVNQQLDDMAGLKGRWDNILGGAESRMGREAQNAQEDAAAQAAARGMQMSPVDAAMMQANAAASQSAAMGQLQGQAVQSKLGISQAAGELAGRAGQSQAMRDQTLAQYALGTLPEAVSLELMGATPEYDWAKGQRQVVGTPWRTLNSWGTPFASKGPLATRGMPNYNPGGNPRNPWTNIFPEGLRGNNPIPVDWTPEEYFGPPWLADRNNQG